jgi:beta-lactamase regulating signal transducer with metallopeptidase domain
MSSDLLSGPPVWTAVGWTMVHVLWVGAAIGLVAAFLRRVLRSATPEIRYGVALICLLALSISPVVIFVRLAERMVVSHPPTIRSTGGVSRLTTSITNLSQVPAVQPTISAATADSSFGIAPRTWLEFVVPCLPWFWLGGSTFTVILLATGLVGVERLRRSSQLAESGDLPRRCRALADSVGIVRHVSVGFCDRLAMPVLIGIFRPLILLPPAALSGWSIEQLEMVLLHELAHLRRRDNLVNLLQRLVESALFFHPAVWWLSSWVRLERELCCDSLVVDRLGEPVAYAKMLVALSRARSQRRRAALSMADRNALKRIRWLLNVEERSMKLTMPEGLGLLGSVALAALLILGSQGAQTKPVDASEKMPQSVPRSTVDEMPDLDAIPPNQQMHRRDTEAADTPAKRASPQSPRSVWIFARDTRRLEITHLPDRPDGVVFYRCRGGIEIISKTQKFATIQMEADEATIKRVGRPRDDEHPAIGPNHETWFEEANLPMEVHLKGNAIIHQDEKRFAGKGDSRTVRGPELHYDFVTERLIAPRVKPEITTPTPVTRNSRAAGNPTRQAAMPDIGERAISLSPREAHSIEITEMPREMDGKIKYICKGGITVVARFEGSGSVSISADKVMIVRKCRFGTGEAIEGTNGGTWLEDEDLPTEIHATGHVTSNTDWKNAAGKVAHWTFRADRLDYDTVTGRLLAKNVKMAGPDFHITAPGIEAFVRPDVKSPISSESGDTSASDKPRPIPGRPLIRLFGITGAKDGPQQTVKP